ncbi:PIN/TRAM domain-containing protein [Anaerotignum sp. MSJ-24]|uniref:PIN/TRAM domain-containing protein n=1 Tax=Anaerotignum sp. MSJ-24 TaxID=2841521 RepID=UPI001C0F9D32|nr:TRAM domain-containing protein [Anaerotignum sp. MSJ-24]MBU5463882.1 TRAM domain-containing protein [Anaerotignum sp. MSJ-24]
MMKNLFRYVITLVVMTIAVVLLYSLYKVNLWGMQNYIADYVVILLGIFIGIIYYILFSDVAADAIMKQLGIAEGKLVKMDMKELASGVAGVVVGLIIANLIGMSLNGYGVVGTGITVILNVVLGFLGYRVATRKRDEMDLPMFKSNQSKSYSGRPKILDTSVIIDGRILDLLQTGFIEGKIIIPTFVLDELRHIADSSDSLKRTKGRRGLDILNEIQKQLSVPVVIKEFNTKEKIEVDSKLLKMAEKLDAFVVTNDYNLNKVAEVQGVKVLNINELANAVKPMLVPGEEMTVTVIKAGKENGQGIAYLNDGTMIVVEGGSGKIGETLKVVVTSVLQTAAGRMIFTKIVPEK